MLLGLLVLGQEPHMTTVRFTDRSGFLIPLIDLLLFIGDPAGEDIIYFCENPYMNVPDLPRFILAVESS